MEILDAVRWEPAEETTTVRGGDDPSPIPPDAMILIELLRDEESPAMNRRRHPRARHVAVAAVEMIGEVLPWRRTVYVRDANQWGIGFVTPDPLPVGKDATLHLVGGDGRPLTLRGCILRCREVLPGWYESAALLYVEEPRLAPQALSSANRR